MMQTNLSEQIKNILIAPTPKNQNPVVRAHNIWNSVSDKLVDLLGETIFNQWFSKLVPLVISDHCLILIAPNSISCHWLNNQYKELIDTLIGLHDKELVGFVLAKEDLNQ